MDIRSIFDMVRIEGFFKSLSADLIFQTKAF